MRLLIVSHACVAPINQQLYAEVQRVTGWQLSLVVPANWRDEYGRQCTVERWPAFTGRLLPVPVRRPGNIILHTYRASFARLIQEESPDVIYVNHEPYAAATAQVYWGNVRSGQRRPIGFYSCQNISKKYPPPFRWTESWVLRTSDFAFPISATVDQVFREKGYKHRSTVLPLAIDPEVYYPRQRFEACRSGTLGCAADADVLIGYVGRLVPEKGLATLLDAMGRLGDLPWRLALVGAGPMEAEIRRSAEAKGISDKVTCAGFVPHVQMPPLLSAMDVLVLPSETQSNWREQFGRVLLEAIACGTPVVGSDSGEIPNLINATGGGLIFRERDSAHLAQQLRLMITDPSLRQRLAAAGSESVANSYKVRHAAEKFVKTINSVATNIVHDFTPDPASFAS